MNDAKQFQMFDEMVDVLSQNTPHALVLDWWRRLERVLDYYFIAFHGRQRPGDYLGMLRADGRVDADVTSVVGDLRVRRNRIAHGATVSLTAEDAVCFARASWRSAWEIAKVVPDELAVSSGAAQVV